MKEEGRGTGADGGEHEEARNHATSNSHWVRE